MEAVRAGLGLPVQPVCQLGVRSPSWENEFFFRGIPVPKILNKPHLKF